jgi:hypothetical protein
MLGGDFIIVWDTDKRYHPRVVAFVLLLSTCTLLA